MGLWRLSVDGVPRFARGPADGGPERLLPVTVDLDEILSGSTGALEAILEGPTEGTVPTGAQVLAPVAGQEVWAAGVTYRRSRDARMEESTAPDHYDRVYAADRPELFFKASAARTRGPGQFIGIRADSSWDVPEAELAVVANSSGHVVGYAIGNDVSSRSIEGENPLYLPQAKSYTGSCALGPCIVPLDEAPTLAQMTIVLQIRRAGAVVYEDQVSVSDLRRPPDELLAWLFRALNFPVGVILLTGTALIPPPQFTLQAGDETTITISGLGSLTNVVEVVGQSVS